MFRTSLTHSCHVHLDGDVRELGTVWRSTWAGLGHRLHAGRDSTWRECSRAGSDAPVAPLLDAWLTSPLAPAAGLSSGPAQKHAKVI